MAVTACVPASHFGTPLTRFVAPQGAPPKTILTIALLTTTHDYVLRQANRLLSGVHLGTALGLSWAARGPSRAPVRRRP